MPMSGVGGVVFFVSGSLRVRTGAFPVKETGVLGRTIFGHFRSARKALGLMGAKSQANCRLIYPVSSIQDFR